MTPIRVRAQGNVLGLTHGDEALVPPTEKVERLIRAGHLLWLDEPGPVKPAPTAKKGAKAKDLTPPQVPTED